MLGVPEKRGWEQANDVPSFRKRMKVNAPPLTLPVSTASPPSGSKTGMIAATGTGTSAMASEPSMETPYPEFVVSNPNAKSFAGTDYGSFAMVMPINAAVIAKVLHRPSSTWVNGATTLSYYEDSFVQALREWVLGLEAQEAGTQHIVCPFSIDVVFRTQAHPQRGRRKVCNVPVVRLLFPRAKTNLLDFRYRLEECPAHVRQQVNHALQPQIMKMLKELHELGLYHLDIKGENIVIQWDQTGRIEAWLIDLGLSWRQFLSVMETLESNGVLHQFHETAFCQDPTAKHDHIVARVPAASQGTMSCGQQKPAWPGTPFLKTEEFFASEQHGISSDMRAVGMLGYEMQFRHLMFRSFQKPRDGDLKSVWSQIKDVFDDDGTPKSHIVEEIGCAVPPLKRAESAPVMPTKSGEQPAVKRTQSASMAQCHRWRRRIIQTLTGSCLEFEAKKSQLRQLSHQESQASQLLHAHVQRSHEQEETNPGFWQDMATLFGKPSQALFRGMKMESMKAGKLQSQETRVTPEVLTHLKRIGEKMDEQNMGIFLKHQKDRNTGVYEMKPNTKRTRPFLNPVLVDWYKAINVKSKDFVGSRPRPNGTLKACQSNEEIPFVQPSHGLFSTKWSWQAVGQIARCLANVVHDEPTWSDVAQVLGFLARFRTRGCEGICWGCAVDISVLLYSLMLPAYRIYMHRSKVFPLTCEKHGRPKCSPSYRGFAHAIVISQLDVCVREVNGGVWKLPAAERDDVSAMLCCAQLLDGKLPSHLDSEMSSGYWEKVTRAIHAQLSPSDWDMCALDDNIDVAQYHEDMNVQSQCESHAQLLLASLQSYCRTPP